MTPVTHGSIVRSAVALLAAVALLTAPPVAAASPLDDLRSYQGKQARIRLQDGRSVNGVLERVESGQLTVDGSPYACADLAEVRIAKKSKRGLWAALGGGAGLAAGLALGVRFSNEGNDSAAALTALGLAGAGAAIGFLGGAGKSQTLTIDADSCP